MPYYILLYKLKVNSRIKGNFSSLKKHFVEIKMTRSGNSCQDYGSGVAKLFLGHKLVQFEWLTHSLTLSPHTTFCIPFRRDLWWYVIRLWRFHSRTTKVNRFRNKSFAKETSINNVRRWQFGNFWPTYNVRQRPPFGDFFLTKKDL